MRVVIWFEKLWETYRLKSDRTRELFLALLMIVNARFGGSWAHDVVISLGFLALLVCFLSSMAKDREPRRKVEL